MEKRVNQLQWGAFLSYAQMAIGIIVGLLYTPIMIRLLGQSEYGLYSTVSSTISLLSILSLGFNSSYIRYYSTYKKENNQDAIDKLNGLFIIIFSIIGAIVLACGIVMSFHLTWIFDTGLTSQEYDIARVLTLLLTVSLALSFPMGVFTHIISAQERFVFLKLVSIAKTVISPLTTVLLLLVGYRSIAMVTVTLCVSLIADVLYIVYAKTRLHTRFVFHGFEKGLVKSLFIYTSFIALNMVVDQINNNVDNFLLGRFKGTDVVAVYAVGYTLYHYYVMFSTAVSNVFTPRIHNIVNHTEGDDVRQRAELTHLFVKVGRIQFLILGLIASGMVFFGQPFIYYWAGAGFTDSYYVALLLILPSTIALIQNIGISIQRAQNRHQFRSIAYVIMAIVNLVLSIFLCQKYGAVGSAIGTAISLILANGCIMNVYYHKKCNVDVITFWKNILRMLLGLIIPLIIGVLLMRFMDLYVIWKLCLFIVAYTVVYCVSVWFLSMNEYERSLIKRFMKKSSKK